MASDEDRDASPLCVDCVIPAHEKDFETLGHTVASLRRCCPEIRRILVVSRALADFYGQLPEAAALGAEHFDEASDVWPFRMSDCEGCGCAPGWLFQQLLKLHAPLLIPGLLPDVLVCDADVIWHREGLQFLEGRAPGQRPVAQLCVFGSDGCPPIRSAVDLHRYDNFVPTVLPGLSKPLPGRQTAVCHHQLLQREVIESLASRVEAQCESVFWVAFRDAARDCEGRASEYELYHAFASRFFAAQVVSRPLPFAVTADMDGALRAPAQGAAFSVVHSHLRGLPAEELVDREGVINGDVQAQVLQRLARGHSPELAALLVGSGML